MCNTPWDIYWTKMIQPQLTLARPQGKVVVFQEMLSHLNSENHKEAKDSLHQTIPKERENFLELCLITPDQRELTWLSCFITAPYINTTPYYVIVSKCLDAGQGGSWKLRVELTVSSPCCRFLKETVLTIIILYTHVISYCIILQIGVQIDISHMYQLVQWQKIEFYVAATF